MRTDTGGGLSRRRFLYGSAAAAGTAALAACTSQDPEPGPSPREEKSSGKGSATDPLKAPARFHEAPELAAKVKAGALPPVEKRLPSKPYVVPHNWLRPGKYGGSLRLIIPSTDDAQMKEYMYGHSPLRWLNDTSDVGPGLAESWDSNADNSEWALHFRDGLRWSDGQLWTTDDIMFWWDDMVLNKDHPEVAPASMHSAKGTVAKISAPDELTIKVVFDAPAPLLPFQVACSVKAGNGPAWTAPKHYLKKFHPKYTRGASAGDWIDTFEQKRNYQSNPSCPTMTGWRLKSYNEGRQLEWERNPYYYAVSREGDQLPYIDRLTVSAVENAKVGKLKIQQGEVDYAHGYFSGLDLSDISGIKATRSRNNLDVILWDSGSGCGSLFFFNFNYREPKLRKLIHEPKFRQALSFALNRDEIRKSVFYNTGENTTGTYSPKAADFQANAAGRRTQREWRDSYVRHDPKKARALLDELGVVDRDGDGLREFPDGSRLRLRLDEPADAVEGSQEMANLIKRDWEALGLEVRYNPISAEAWDVHWGAGELMTYTSWWMGSMGVHEVMADPELIAAVEGAGIGFKFWAPLYARYHAIRNTSAAHELEGVDPYDRDPPSMEPEKGSPVDRLWKLYDRALTEQDAMKRYSLVWKMIKIHVSEGPFFMGVVANSPTIELAHKDMGNVPLKKELQLGGFTMPWTNPTPAVYDPEVYYWKNPGDHR